MSKAMIFLVHNLGLGDVISFSPLFLIALREGYTVDIAYSTGRPEKIIELIFGRELNDKSVRIFPLKEVLTQKDIYEIAIMGDRRCIRTAISMGKSRIKAVLPIPLHAGRKRDIFLYNKAIIPILGVFGIQSHAIAPNPGENVGQLVFDKFCLTIGKKGSFRETSEKVRERISAHTKVKKGPKFILVHLFRNLYYKMLDRGKLELIAEWLGQEYPGYRILVLSDPKNAWENENAGYFSELCRKNGLKSERLHPALDEICGLAGSAQLYLGVDHGISHLATLFCKRSIVIYGGSSHLNDIHALWPPQVNGRLESISRNISRISGKERRAALIHPSGYEYISHSKKDSALINKIVTRDNLNTALKSLGK